MKILAVCLILTGCAAILTGCAADTFTGVIDPKPDASDAATDAVSEATVEDAAPDTSDAGPDVSVNLHDTCPGFGVCTPGLAFLVWGDDGGTWTKCTDNTPPCPSGMHCGTFSGWENDASSGQAVCP